MDNKFKLQVCAACAAVPLHQPQDEPTWVARTPDVMKHLVSPGDGTSLSQRRDKAGMSPEDHTTPADRIPKSTLQTAGANVMTRIKAYYSKSGIDTERMHEITSRSEGPRWWESEDRKERLKPRPLRDAASHGLTQHFNNHYAHGHR